jgi:hypothetical protein
VPDLLLRAILLELLDDVVAILLEDHVLRTGWPRIVEYLDGTGQLAARTPR